MTKKCGYVALVLAAISLVSLAQTSCTSNRKGNSWCATRIAYMKTLAGYNAANPASPYTGNLCTTSAGDNGLFRWQMCCLACQEFLGGSGQAEKESSFMGSSVGAICTDMTTAAALCAKYTASSTECTNPVIGKIYCPNTCGFCFSSTQQELHTTASPCTSLATCNNQTMCRQTGQSAGAGSCTSDGTAVVADTVYLNGGKCNCDECINTLGKDCNGDADCAGLPHHCQAGKGKCNCGQCTRGKVCKDDGGCGGVMGTCGYVNTGVKTETNKDNAYVCPAEGTGENGEFCTCLWCPGTTACRNQGTACTASDAVTLCGHADYCQGPTDSATCSCKPAATFTGTTEWKPTSLTAATAGEASICIDAIKCAITAGATDHTACGVGNNAACQRPDGTQCIEGDTTCKCNCAQATTTEPNLCLGLSTDANSNSLSCEIAGATSCGWAAEPKAGDSKYDICVPDMSTGMCMCGLDLYPKYTASNGQACLTYSDCQTATDTSGVCGEVADSPAAKCTETTLDITKCQCYPATALLVGVASAYVCTVDAECGWGKCMEADMTQKCLPVASGVPSTCKCAPAGCTAGRACGLSVTKETCGGLDPGCEGKCFCG